MKGNFWLESAIYGIPKRRLTVADAIRNMSDEKLAEDYSIHRIMELMRADKDGRLVVLPRAPGLTLTNKNELYLIGEDEGKIYRDGLYGVEVGMNSEGRIAMTFTTLDSWVFYDGDIGQTVFLLWRMRKRYWRAGDESFRTFCWNSLYWEGL